MLKGGMSTVRLGMRVGLQAGKGLQAKVQQW
jgi:hypothetical protein